MHNVACTVFANRNLYLNQAKHATYTTNTVSYYTQILQLKLLHPRHRNLYRIHHTLFMSVIVVLSCLLVDVLEFPSNEPDATYTTSKDLK